MNSDNSIPKPVFLRMLMLFLGGAGCILIGIVATIATQDFVLLAMSAIIGVALITKGFLLKSKIKGNQIYNVSGVCVSIVPKILGRYRRIELVDVNTGIDVHFILPKKVVFKVGHIYNCYFDNQISNRPDGITPSGVFFNSELDLPTNGFLGFEDFGVYQEKPIKTEEEKA